MGMQEKINEVAIKWADEYDSRDPLQIAKLSDAIIAVLREQEPIHGENPFVMQCFIESMQSRNFPIKRKGDGFESSWTQAMYEAVYGTVSRLRLYALPIPPVEQADSGQVANAELLAWAVSRWKGEVENRPLINVHRRSLDDTWRQVIRYLGGDPDELLGMVSHDELCTLRDRISPLRADDAALSEQQPGEKLQCAHQWYPWPTSSDVSKDICVICKQERPTAKV